MHISRELNLYSTRSMFIFHYQSTLLLGMTLQKWYPVSKTLAEKAAWEFVEKHGMDVVSILPATCLGPLLQPNLNASCAVLQQLLQGSKDSQEYHWLGAVHVKDIARAQVLLFEAPTASGRYLCTNGIYQFSDFADKVAKIYPEFPVHRSELELKNACLMVLFFCCCCFVFWLLIWKVDDSNSLQVRGRNATGVGCLQRCSEEVD